MPRKIDPDACVDCGACESECPTAAISANPYVVDPTICNDCNNDDKSKCEEACPVEDCIGIM